MDRPPPPQVIIVTKDSSNIIRSRSSRESNRLPSMQQLLMSRISSSSIRRSTGSAGSGNPRSLNSPTHSNNLLRTGPLEYMRFRTGEVPTRTALNQLDRLASEYKALSLNYLNSVPREHLFSEGLDANVLRTRRVVKLKEVLKKLPNFKNLQKGIAGKHLKNDGKLERLIYSAALEKADVKVKESEPELIVIDKRYLLDRPELMEEFECPNKEQFRSDKQEWLSSRFAQTVSEELKKRSSSVLNSKRKEAFPIPVLNYEDENVTDNFVGGRTEQEFLDVLLAPEEPESGYPEMVVFDPNF